MSPIKIGLVTGASLLALGIIFGTYFTVSEQERCVITTWGKFSYVASPGIGFKVPFAQGSTCIPVAITSVTTPKALNTYTIDNQEIDITFTLFHRTPVDQVEYVFKNVPDQSARLQAMATDRIKVEVGKINVTNFAENRGQLRDKIKNVLATDAKSLGAEITDFQITNADYADSFRAAIGMAAAAKAQVETREQEQRQEQIKANTAKIVAEGQANQARAVAAGAADARLLQARAEAQAIELQGEAQAKAIKAQSDALSTSPSFVEYTKAQRWTGVLPQQIYGSAPIPFMSIGAK